MQFERWRDIPGWEGRYQASTLGRIRSVSRRGRTGCMLRQRYIHRKRSEVQDARVNLYHDGQCHTLKVGKLVALAWCAGYAPGMSVNHKDGNSLNNRSDNLEWITLAENIEHAVDNGLIQANACALANADETISYRTQSAAERAIGRSHGYISRRLRQGKHTAIGLDGTEYQIKGEREKGA